MHIMLVCFCNGAEHLCSPVRLVRALSPISGTLAEHALWELAKKCC